MWLMEIIKLSGLKWSALTRQRRVDAIVGLVLHCLLLTMYALLVTITRVVLAVALSIYTCVVRIATLLGLIRPVRLIGDKRKVREQLESATLMRGAGFNLVLFEDLSQ